MPIVLSPAEQRSLDVHLTPLPKEVTYYPDCTYGETGLAQFVDIRNYRNPAVSWGELHDAAAGTSVGAGILTVRASYPNPNKWYNIIRHALPFWSSDLLPGIAQAKIRLKLASWFNSFAEEAYVNIYGYAPADAGDHTIYDYNAFNAIPFSTPLSMSSYVSEAWNEFELNAAGLAAIVEGVSKFCIRITWDADNAPPSWVAGGQTTLIVRSSELVVSNVPLVGGYIWELYKTEGG